MYAKWTVILTLLVVVSATAPAAQEQATSKHRKKATQLFEENDANKDGFLTIEEDIAYRALRLASRGRQQAAQPERSREVQQSVRTNRSRVPEVVTVKQDIVYARVSDRNLPLDIYIPDKAAKPMPVIIWVHGGGYRRETETVEQ